MQANSQPSKRLQYNEYFQQELSKLNLRQRQAVQKIEGPVMVIAGPGTGKTHLLAARIGKILLHTDTGAQNILCLTFTDAGVSAMRNRLLSFIGPEAHRVHIYTFHSFCNAVIKDHLELFGRHDLEAISDLERIEIIRALLDSLPAAHLLRQKTTDPYFYEKHLHDLFRRIKSENWSITIIHKAIEDYLQDLPSREEYIYKRKGKDFHKGDLKQWKYDEQKNRMQILTEAVRLFPDYVERMRKARRYDYEDMIQWVLDAFEKNVNLLRSYQERYQYFLVDEYQDTNGAQNKILQLLIDYWDNPNVFIVGDDDQSIFEFQGARLKNLVDFYHKYKNHIELIVLTDNYRSSQLILDTAKQVIEHNQNRIANLLPDVDKTLFARHPQVAASESLAQILEYPNRTHENADIVQSIQELQKKGVPLSEIAIIYAKHRQAEDIISLLEKKDIPFQTKREVNILSLPAIRNLRTLLHYLYMEYARPGTGEHLLYRILHFDFWQIAPTDLFRISTYMAKHSQNTENSWRMVLNDTQIYESLSLKNATHIRNTIQLLEELIGDYVNISVPRFIEKLLNRSGWLAHIIKQPDKIKNTQVINTFMTFVKKEAYRHPALSLKKLLDTLRSMDANRLALPLQRDIKNDDALQLMTAHACKGLEFEHVFIIDATKEQWEPSRSSGGRRFHFPDTLTQSGEEDAMEARRRLFYVAMTRAKKYLYISYSKESAEAKPYTSAAFIDETTATGRIDITPKKLPDTSLLEMQYLSLQEQKMPALPALEKALADHLLENFVLSISSLNTYLRCPLSFYYEKVLRIPTVQSEAASYGTAIHFALRRLFEKMKSDKHKSFPPVSFLQKAFEEEMKRHRAYFQPTEYQRRLDRGFQILQGYYDQHHHHWKKQVLIEYDIRNVEMNGVPLKGVLDRVDLSDKGTAHILDYKTGSLNKSKVRPPTDAYPLGGNYWRQLYFYKMLFESKHPDKIVRTAAISYMEPDSNSSFQEHTLEYSSIHLDLVKDMIRSTWQKIQAHDFYQGCNESNCLWCRFTRNNIPTDSLTNIEAEELDDL